jgi:PAS domain S-box-containing protein
MVLRQYTMKEQFKIQATRYREETLRRSDKLMDYFLACYGLTSLSLAFFYNTWLIALVVGGTALIVYYSVKELMPRSNLYQYVLSAVFGVFTVQFIYQMDGLFEMYFFAFIGSAMLITYQKWKLQIPLLAVVIILYVGLTYLNNLGYRVYTAHNSRFAVPTFVIHILLTTAIFFICGLWAYQLSRCQEKLIRQTILMGELKREAQLSEERCQKEQALEERNNILESIADAFFATDKNWMVTYWNSSAEKMLGKHKEDVLGRSLWEAYADVIGTPFHTYFNRAQMELRPQHFEISYGESNNWYDVSIYPSGIGTSVYLRNINQRKSSELQMQQLNQELTQHAKELARSNEELEQFAYVASHDMQEPLRMVTGFLSQFKRKYYNIVDDTGKDYLRFALEGSLQMKQIIYDLLEYSRVGRIEDNKEEIALNELVSDISNIYRKQIQEKKIIIHCEDLPVINAPKGAIRQVFQNLISNGIKYQKPGNIARINISCQKTDDHYRFSVQDNGIGIRPEYFGQIFIVFRRLNTKGRYPGTGMGLAITKKIIENLGGTIQVESSEDKGSIFHFTILNQK